MTVCPMSRHEDFGGQRTKSPQGTLRPDVMFVDAPVSGSKGPAEAGQLLILASGPPAAVAAVRRYFRRSTARPCGWATPARAAG